MMISTPAKLLVVDGDANDAFVLKHVLGLAQQQLGFDFHIEQLATLQDALDLLEAAPRDEFALIYLDLMVPDLEGLEFLEALRSDRRSETTPVIMVTTATNPEHCLQALESGAREVHSKPDSLQDLFDIVLGTLERHLDRTGK